MKRTFGRLQRFDVRSRMYGVSIKAPEVVNEQPPVNKEWLCSEYLDQGQEGSCVGFANGHELLAGPIVVPADHDRATGIYLKAREIGGYAAAANAGATILDGARAMRELGYISEWWWCFGLKDLIMTLGYIGPVVLGLNWYEGMSQPSSDGLIRPTGEISGGHAILCKGVNVDHKYFILHNSWGYDWGDDGNCYVLFSDMELLLLQRGEAAVMIDVPSS